MIDNTGNPRLADFGLITIMSDPKNHLSSSSAHQGGTFRWMSPELFDPPQFGLKKRQPTKSSDCYALGMVIYEIVSGRLPFHEDADYAIFLKVMKGERPLRRAMFTDRLWKMLEWCWTPQPNDRPNIQNVLECLEIASSSPEPPLDSDEDVESSGDDWDSDSSSVTQSWTNGTMIVGKGVDTPGGLSHQIAPQPPSASELVFGGLGGDTGPNLSVSHIDSGGGSTRRESVCAI